eukprot:5251335-Prymnesium_polylepis.1
MSHSRPRRRLRARPPSRRQRCRTVHAWRQTRRRRPRASQARSLLASHGPRAASCFCRLCAGGRGAGAAGAEAARLPRQ